MAVATPFDPRKVRVDGYDWEPAWHTDVALDFIRRHSSAGNRTGSAGELSQ